MLSINLLLFLLIDKNFYLKASKLKFISLKFYGTTFAYSLKLNSRSKL